jgi:superoxide dismutase
MYNTESHFCKEKQEFQSDLNTATENIADDMVIAQFAGSIQADSSPWIFEQSGLENHGRYNNLLSVQISNNNGFSQELAQTIKQRFYHILTESVLM